MITVKEYIEYLKTLPQDYHILYDFLFDNIIDYTDVYHEEKEVIICK